MKLPIVSREAYAQALLRAVNAERTVEHLEDRILEQERQIAELKALFSKTSQFEVVKQDEQTVTLKSKPVDIPGRGGWRGRRAAQEQSTTPVPADSMAALNQRIQKEIA